jgi:hypothetical protein
MRFFPAVGVKVSSPLRLCAAAALILCAPFAVWADTVAGRMYGVDEKPLANMTFKAKPAKGDVVEFKTNGTGAFSVYLDPGRYTVSPSADASVQGVINSFPQPVQQDVHLKKAGT